MAISWGPWETAPSPGGTSGMRVGLEASWSSPSNTSTTATLTVKVYTENYLTYTGDSQVINFGGTAGSGWSDYSFSNSSGTSPVLRTTKTYTYTYGSTSYGTSPGTKTVSATMSGVFDGTTASHTITVTIPARPFAAPSAPSSVVATRNSDAQATVTWVRNATTAKPYTSQTLQMRTFTGSTWSAWTTVATLSSTATSYVKTGLSPNRVYGFQIRANNSVGSSAYVAAPNSVWMTPAAPTNVAAAINAAGTQITVTWTPQNYMGTTSTNQGFYVQRSVNGGAFATVATLTSQSASSWTDPSPGGGTNQYQVAAYETVVGSLTSTYTQSNVVTTIVPPLAPTQLAPSGTAVDLANTAVTLSWKHNPGTDNAPQSAYTVEYSTNGGGSWTNLATVSSTVSQHVIPAGTLANGVVYQWRVRTVGVTSGGYGPNSAAATITGSAKPTLTFTAPGPTVASLPFTVSWDYNQDQGSPQASWWASLFDANMVVLQQLHADDASEAIVFDYPVTDSQSYVIQIQARSAAGLLSDIATTTTFINLPSPAAIVTDAEYQSATGSVLLSMIGANPLPAPPNRTNLITNPSWRTAGALAEVRRNYITDPYLTTASGWTGVAAGGGITAAATQAYSPNQAAAVGEVWTVAMDITASATRDETGTLSVGSTAGGLFGALARGNTAFTIPAGTTQRVVNTFTLPAGADGLRALATFTSAVPAGVKIGRAGMYKAGAEVSFFAGNLDPEDGLVYSWVGTANASASIASGPTVANAPFLAYAGTLGVVGWQSGADTYRVLLKNDVPDGGILGFASSAPPAVAAGQFRAGRFKTRLVNSDIPYEIRPRILSYDGSNVAQSTIAQRTINDVLIPADQSWQDLSVPSTAAAPASAATARWLVYAGQAIPAGTIFEFKEGLIESVAGVGIEPGPYFDGSTQDIPTMDFAWSGVANASTSTGTGQAEIAVSWVNIERRVDGGEWVTLAENLRLPGDFVDPLPKTNGLNEYRLTSVSTAPSFRANDIVQVIPENAAVPGANPADQWVFVNYGDAFDKLLRFRSSPELKATAGRQKAMQRYLGRTKPVVQLGEARSRGVDVSGSLVYDAWGDRPDQQLWDSPPNDWEEMAEEAELVCYRDFTGRRIFGSISEISTANVQPGLASLGFSVEESDFIERYGPQE